MRFPTISGENLNREHFDLPDDFGPGRTLVLVAYYQPQQRDVDTWLRVAVPWEGELADFQVIELPVIRRLPRIAQRYIDGGMRSGIPDPAARARTITIYTDVGAFNRELGLRTKQVHALLVEDGQVVWQKSGPVTEEAVGELRRRLAGSRPET
jgi:hypothetical protein